MASTFCSEPLKRSSVTHSRQRPSGTESARARRLWGRFGFTWAVAFAAFLSACAPSPKEGEVTGCFLRSDTDGHEGIWIFMPGTPYQASTDRHGRFHIAGINPGEYELVVQEPGYEEVREEIRIVAGAQVNLGTQTLLLLPPLTGIVSGRALLEGKESHEGIIVLLMGTPHSTITDQEGTFRFDYVYLGTYRLVAFKDGYHSLTDMEVTLDEPIELILSDLTLSPFEIAAATETPTRKAGDRFLWGRVILENEIRHGETTVSVAEEPDLSTITLADGRFQLDNLHEGPYTVEIAHDGFVTEQLTGVLPSSATEGIGIQVTLRRETQPIGRGVLQGFVTLQDQTNHEGTTVRLVGVQPSAITDYSGRYIFVDIPSTNYVLEASHPGYKTSRVLGVELVADTISEAPPIELLPVTIEDLEEGVEGYGSLEGIVTLEDDPNAGGVTIAIQTANLVTLSMPGGAFSFADVPAGHHLIIFDKAGYETAYLPDVPVLPNQVTPLDPVVLERQVEHPYVVATAPPDRARRVGFDEFLDVLVKFSDRMDANSVKRSVFISPPVEARMFFGRESELSDSDTLHMQWLRAGRNPLRFQTTYEVVIGQSATNVRGVSLDDDYAFRFATDGPLIVRTVPPDRSRDVSLPGDRLIIETNVPVDPTSLANSLRIYPRGESIPEIYGSRRGSGGRVEIEVGLNFGKRYSVSIGRQLRTTDRQLFSNTPYRFSFSTAEIRDDLPEPDVELGRRRSRAR